MVGIPSLDFVARGCPQVEGKTDGIIAGTALDAEEFGRVEVLPVGCCRRNELTVKPLQELLLDARLDGKCGVIE